MTEPQSPEASQTGPPPEAAPAPSDAIPAGTLIGRYRIDALLGRGALGDVYRAWDRKHEQAVALKLLPADLPVTPEFLAQFKQEGRVLAKLQHEHLVRLRDGGRTDQGRYYTVWTLVEGPAGRAPTLADEAASQKGRLPWQVVSQILLKVLDGLAYAHDQGALHGNLKPSNILLGPDDGRGPRVYLTDLGLMRLVGQEWMRARVDRLVAEAKARAGRLDDVLRSALRTSEYISPEQRAGGSKLDGRSDLYAVGMIAYRMLTGRRPDDVFRAPSQYDATLPTFWDRLTRQALQASPASRFASAKGMRDFLEQESRAPMRAKRAPPAGAKPGAATPGSPASDGPAPAPAAPPPAAAAVGGASGLTSPEALALVAQSAASRAAPPPAAGAPPAAPRAAWLWAVLAAVGFGAAVAAAGVLAGWKYAGAYLVAMAMLTVVLWVLVDSAQRYFYDETSANMLPRSLVAAAICSLLVILVPVETQNLLSIKPIVVHLPAWALVFRFVFLFATAHALGVGLAAAMIFLPLVTLTYASIFFPNWLTE